MQLTGQLVLSAALLLLTAPTGCTSPGQPGPHRGGQTPKAEAEGGGRGLQAACRPGGCSQAPRWDLRRPRGRGPQDCQAAAENTEASRVLATGASSAVSEAGEARKAGRKRAGEEHAGQRWTLTCQLSVRRGQEAGTARTASPELPHCPDQCSKPPNPQLASPLWRAAVWVVSSPPGQDSGTPQASRSGSRNPPTEGQAAHCEGQCDMNNSWVFTHASGVHSDLSSRGPPGCLWPGPGPASAGGRPTPLLHLSSVARVRLEENFILEKLEGIRAQAEGQGVRLIMWSPPLRPPPGVG